MEVPSGEQSRNEWVAHTVRTQSSWGLRGRLESLLTAVLRGAWCRYAPPSLKSGFQDMAAPFKLDCLLRGGDGVCPESVVNAQLLMRLFLQKQPYPAKFVICR